MLPNAWHNKDRWSQGLTHSTDALEQLCGMALKLEALGQIVRSWPSWLQLWMADALAWLQCVIASCVRDVWVQPRRSPSHVSFDWDAFRNYFDDFDADPSNVELAQLLQAASDEGHLPASVSLKIFRYLKPPKPTPRITPPVRN